MNPGTGVASGLAGVDAGAGVFFEGGASEACGEALPPNSCLRRSLTSASRRARSAFAFSCNSRSTLRRSCCSAGRKPRAGQGRDSARFPGKPGRFPAGRARWACRRRFLALLLRAVCLPQRQVPLVRRAFVRRKSTQPRGLFFAVHRGLVATRPCRRLVRLNAVAPPTAAMTSSPAPPYLARRRGDRPGGWLRCLRRFRRGGNGGLRRGGNGGLRRGRHTGRGRRLDPWCRAGHRIHGAAADERQGLRSCAGLQSCPAEEAQTASPTRTKPPRTDSETGGCLLRSINDFPRGRSRRRGPR